MELVLTDEMVTEMVEQALKVGLLMSWLLLMTAHGTLTF